MARVSRESYLEAALEVLADSGAEGLTIARLCTRLEVTKGSFYHHFGGMPELVTALLGFWEDARSNQLIALSASEPDPRARAELLTSIAAGLPHAAEAALRSWGRGNPEVRTAVQRVDQTREDHIYESMHLAGMPVEQARLLAKTAIAVLVGTQQRENPVDARSLQTMLENLDSTMRER
ncbi:MAG TPA: helix-turn-helix domain-containing protein [Pseudonocardia sp.]|jgi:AcrR family transcriptional regulator|nr:helix-turn-helix domain-containing protein [Pseudonocardia sp.]